MRRTGKNKYNKSTLKWYKLAKKQYRGGAMCEVGTGSGKCKVVVQAEN